MNLSAISKPSQEEIQSSDSDEEIAPQIKVKKN